MTMWWLIVFLVQVTQTDSLYHFNFENKQVSQPVGTEVGNAGKIKFLEIEVTRVDNPKAYPISFLVNYTEAGKASIVLGGFSLYPPFNPDKFKVATKGKLSAAGTISITLSTSENYKPGDPLTITMMPARFKYE
jgi:hypothetical protein